MLIVPIRPPGAWLVRRLHAGDEDGQQEHCFVQRQKLVEKEAKLAREIMNQANRSQDGDSNEAN